MQGQGKEEGGRDRKEREPGTVRSDSTGIPQSRSEIWPTPPTTPPTLLPPSPLPTEGRKNDTKGKKKKKKKKKKKEEEKKKGFAESLCRLPPRKYDLSRQTALEMTTDK